MSEPHTLPPEIFVQHARVLRSVNKFADAEQMLRYAIAQAPDEAYPYANLADLFLDMGRFEDAIEQYEMSLGRRNTVEMLSNMGVALLSAGRLTDAEAAYRRALEMVPGCIPVLINLAGIMSVTGRPEEAVAIYRQIVALAPDDPITSVAHSNLIFTMDLVEGSEAEKQAERRTWERLHVRAEPFTAWANDRLLDRPLRIGYVSGDFRHHSAADLFAAVIRHHDRERFKPYLYHSGRIGDDRTVEFYGMAEGWTEMFAMPDADLAAKIRADRIDILVDLSGHSKGNRLTMFALHPAPVQVTGWGHPTGTGLKAIDWLMGDPFAIPAEHRALFAEKIWDLPCFLSYEPPKDAPAIAPKPGRAFTYGSLNRTSKLSPRTLAAWAEILKRAPETQLLLKDYTLDTEAERVRFWEFFKAQEIDPYRVELRGGSSKAQHFATYNEIDLALDPFPQSGGTTSMEAMYMGVPVLAMAGASVSARGTASINWGLGLPHLIAADEADYIARAVVASRYIGQVDRTSLRAMLMGGPGDGRNYCRNVEAAYRAMWKEWCEK